MRTEFGIAVLGCGYWGMNYVRVFGELPGTRVLAVCDKEANRLQEVGKRFPGVILTTDVEHALRVDGVDAVVICTQAGTHFAIAKAALLAGKHVLVEKPLTTNTRDATELIELARELGLTLMVGHTFLYNAGIRAIKEFVRQGEVGRVYYLYASRTNMGPIRRDVNALWDLAPHDVAVFNYLLDSTPEWVSAVGVKALRSHREDVGFISLGYPGDVVGHVHVSWADPNKVRELVVVGSDKRIAFNDLNPLEPVRIYEKSVAHLPGEAANFGEYHFLMRDGNIISPRIELREPLKTQSTHFVECARASWAPLSGGAEGREVVRVMEAIDRSLKRRGAPVAVGGEQRHGDESANGHRNGHANGHVNGHGNGHANGHTNGHHQNGRQAGDAVSAVR